MIRRLGVVLGLCLLLGCSQGNDEAGRQLPPLDLLTQDGERLQWSATDDYVLLNVWAPWCKPCVDEMPSLDRLDQAGQGVRVVGVAPADDLLLADEFLRKHDIGFPSYYDDGQVIDQVLDIAVYPSSLLLAPGGRVIGVAVGPREWDADAQLDWIRNRMRDHARS